MSTGKPRLLIVVNVFNPDFGGGGALFSDLAYGLAERGLDVTVRCAYPYYPEWRDKSGKNGLSVERYEDHGVHVERFGIFIPSKPNSLVQRLFYEASFLLSLGRSILRGRGYDLVMVFCPLVGSVAFAVLNKWVYRKPLWLNVQDLSADAAAAGGIVKGKALKHAMGGIQGWFFNQAHVWSSISPVMIQRLEAIRTGRQPILYMPNWLHASMAGELAQLPSKLGRPAAETPRLLYSGNIGTKQDLLRFCQALQRSSARFLFRIHGDGGRAGEVREWVRLCGDARFVFGDLLDETGYARALHETDYFVITEKAGSGGSFLPSKMIAGLVSGSPILAVCDAESPLGLEMHVAQPGPWFSWEQLDAVPSALESADGNTFRHWQENALQRSAFHDREHVIDRFAAAMDRIVAADGAIPADLAADDQRP